MLCFSNHSVCELSLVLGEMSLFLLSVISVTKSGSNPDVIRRQTYLWRTEVYCLQHFWALTVWVHLLKKKMKFVYVYETESERTTSIQPWILSDITAGFTDKKTKDSVSVCKQLYKCMKESSESNRRIIYCSRENPELNDAETEGKQRGEEVVFAGFTGKHEIWVSWVDTLIKQVTDHNREARQQTVIHAVNPPSIFWRWRKQTYSKSTFNMESYFSSSTPAGGGKPLIDICQRQKTGGTSGPASSSRSFLSFCGSSKGKHRPKFSLSSVNPEFSSWRGLLLLSSVLPLFCIICWWSDWRVGGAHKAEQYK